MDYITFALPKGRLSEHIMEILKRVDVNCPEMENKGRKLIFTNEEDKYKFFLSKTSDVPTYVEKGAADIGFVGKDTLLEEDRNLVEILDLNLGKCTMMIAGFPEDKETYMEKEVLKIATKYPKIAKDYFNSKGINVDIIKLNGSVELGPIVGLSHCIVDIVESGKTLKENGLIVFDEICPLSARVIVNKVSFKRESKRIHELILKLREELSND